MCSLKGWLPNLTSFENFFGAKSAIGVDWTLSVELIFYVFVGMIILLRKKIKRQYVYEVCAFAWMSISFALNTFVNTESGFLKYVSILIAAPYAHMFVAGIMLRMLYDGRNKLFATIGVILSLISHCCRYSKGYSLFYMIVVAVLYIWFAIPVGSRERVEAKMSQVCLVKPIIWIAKISFPLYLIHEYIGFSLISYFDTKNLPNNI